MFSWYHALIVLVPLFAVCGFAIHCRKFVRGVADFLAAGRCAGRYLLRSGNMMANMSAVTIISYSEVHCANGWMYAFWNGILTPISIVMAYYGWISYRFRETRAMSAGQFFEMRYSRGFRRLAAIVRGSADLLSNCIGPAVAVRFLIYLLGLPFTFTLMGHEFHTFPFLLAACLALAILMILAGAVVTLGLYWRRGTTAGAYAAIISGGGISLAAILIQRNWASAVYPWLAAHGWDGAVRHALEVISSPFVPWIDWRVTDALWPVKFPVNSIEISFIAGMTAFLLYVVISLLTCREPFNLERMLHRGQWAEHPDAANEMGAQTVAARPSFFRRLLNHLVGITPEFTRGDRIIAWAGFFKHMVWDWCIAYALCAVVAWFCHWGVREWAMRCFVVVLIVPITFNAFTTVWFTWGTIIDLRRLFHDLAARKRNDLDNGMVEGHVSLADKGRE